MKKLQPVSDRYLSLLPDNSLAYVAGNGNQTFDDFVPLCADFMGALGEAMAPNSTNTAPQVPGPGCAQRDRPG